MSLKTKNSWSSFSAYISDTNGSIGFKIKPCYVLQRWETDRTRTQHYRDVDQVQKVYSKLKITETYWITGPDRNKKTNWDQPGTRTKNKTRCTDREQQDKNNSERERGIYTQDTRWHKWTSEHRWVWWHWRTADGWGWSNMSTRKMDKYVRVFINNVYLSLN